MICQGCNRHVIFGATGARLLAAQERYNVGPRAPIFARACRDPYEKDQRQLYEYLSCPFIRLYEATCRYNCSSIRTAIEFFTITNTIVLAHLGHGTYHNYNHFLCYL